MYTQTSDFSLVSLSSVTVKWPFSQAPGRWSVSRDLVLRITISVPAPLTVPGLGWRLTRHDEVDHCSVIPGEALGPAQLGLWGPDIQDTSLAVVWAPHQALQVPGLGLFPTSWIDALPASRRHILREPHQALALLQQLKLQEVATPT